MDFNEIVEGTRVFLPVAQPGALLYALMTVGLGGTLEDALRSATSALGQWLEQDYHLTPSEIAVVLGSSVEYSISEVADRNAGVAAKIRKDRLNFR